MRPWLHLARISNLPTAWTNVTAAWLLAGGALLDARLAWLILAGSLIYTGGMILNDAADVKFDREHRKERPIPSGKVGVRTAWAVGGGMLFVGGTIALGKGASPQITGLLLGAILFYDLYHKQWAGSVIIMGACRLLLYLMAASAVVPYSAAGPMLVLPYAIALGCYIVGITLAARLEHKNAALPIPAAMLAFALLYTPAVLCVMRFSSQGGSPLQLVVLGVVALLVAYATHILRQGGPAIGKAVGWLLAGIALVDALAISNVSVPLALCFVALTPLLRLWQRWVAAT
ncbi:MAG: UbiA family prenyltransferase [Prosthecobacter sp.]|uniref:UbiA family prenyltransferase n=1 Tax=Prosthecobacter sp. TaxID=1965333 RepID=UPI0025CE2F98|nr:UbiA family prenyltransferase [Prosthecobacter sp.]MCF7785734.1 UbiA family prenyltransferase [Prosthecobacter sp.]